MVFKKKKKKEGINGSYYISIYIYNEFILNK